MRISIQAQDFDLGAEVSAISKDSKIGAVASFVGLVRDVRMTLEHYPGMTENAIRKIVDEAASRWQVTDCMVTMVESNYSSPDGPASTRGPLSTAADFRKLTPLALMRALEQAGTVVCEPTAKVSLEIPTDAIGAVMPALARLDAAVEPPTVEAGLAVIGIVLPSTRVHALQRQLPALTGGAGVLESSFAGYQPVTGDPPTRRRTTPNPLNRREYLLRVTRHLQAPSR